MRIIYYLLLGACITAIELFLLNVVPVLGSVELLFLTLLILLFDHKTTPAALVGVGGYLSRDILSVDLFGIHLVVFIIVFISMLLLLEWVFTNKAFVAYFIFGFFMVAMIKVFSAIAIALSKSIHDTLPLLMNFPSIFLVLIVNGSILAFLVYWRALKSERIVVPWVIHVRR